MAIVANQPSKIQKVIDGWKRSGRAEDREESSSRAGQCRVEHAQSVHHTLNPEVDQFSGLTGGLARLALQTWRS